MKVIKYIPSLLYSMIIGLNLYYAYKKELVLIAIFLLILPLLYEYFKCILTYKGPLDIKTPDGSDQPYHPSVEFINMGWQGYRYWMAYTPFPIGRQPYRDRWEYPCICVSNDGKQWTDINDNKPLDDLNEIQIQNKDYFSDTHLVYNSEKNRLECYYRLSEETYCRNNEKGVWLFRKYSYDGITWSDREVSIHPMDESLDENGFPRISPAITKNESYKMWYVINNNEEYTIWSSTSIDGLTWSKGVKCILKDMQINPWHIDCKMYGELYYMLIYDFTQRLTLWTSEDGINFTFEKNILKASHKIGSFYKMTLYRSCMLKDDEGYKVYFSAGNERQVKIGLLAGENFKKLAVCNVSNNFSLREFIIDYYEKYFFVERWIIWKIKIELRMKNVFK